jgi:hypothetical protein
MTLNPGETSLVVAGAWNPAILTPAWVLRFGLARPDSQEQVQVAMLAGQGVVFDFPRYTLPEFSYIVRPDTLIITPPAQTTAFAIIEDVAAAMLENLPHTPVNGIGHNFEFRDANPQHGALTVFTEASQGVADHAPGDWATVGTMINSSFRCGNGTTFANVQRQFDGTNIIVKFNFHHPIATVEQALQVLRGQGHPRMGQSFETARDLVSNLYGPIQ